MIWLRRIRVAAFFLIYLLSSIWYVALWISGPPIRRFLVLNVALLCGMSVLVWLAPASMERLTSRSKVRFRDWHVGRFTFGLALAVILFLAEKVIGFTLGEAVVFSIWPNSLVLLVPSTSWDIFSIFLSAFAFIANGALYTAWASLVWSVLNLLTMKSEPDLRMTS